MSSPAVSSFVSSSRLAGATLVKKKKKKVKGASIKPDLWKRTGFVPNKLSAKEIHRKSYEARMRLPEGKGTGRSMGSNRRLRKLLEK